MTNHRPGEIDATKCGVAYCEHHREGLPYCVECREESTLAHDKACALLAEARAEIERKDKLIEQMREALEIAYKYLHAHAERTKDKYVIKDLLTVKAAIRAAKGEV